MSLRLEEIDAFFELLAPSRSAEDRAQFAERLRGRVERGEADLADYFVAREGDALLGAVRLAELGGGLYSLLGPSGAPDAAATLVASAVARARSIEASVISARPRADRELGGYPDALAAAGFEKRGERIEFKAPVAELPDDDGSPLTWVSMRETGRPAAAELYAAAGDGDPHGFTEDDDPAALLDSYLADVKLGGNEDCVALGYLDGEPVAFVCAQVDSSDGWCRITYMGLVDSARGRGLGRWVHRRGFVMMKQQGGVEYHGGTAMSNTGMLKLFAEHGCTEKWRLLEYEWRP